MRGARPIFTVAPCAEVPLTATPPGRARSPAPGRRAAAGAPRRARGARRARRRALRDRRPAVGGRRREPVAGRAPAAAPGARRRRARVAAERRRRPGGRHPGVGGQPWAGVASATRSSSSCRARARRRQARRTCARSSSASRGHPLQHAAALGGEVDRLDAAVAGAAPALGQPEPLEVVESPTIGLLSIRSRRPSARCDIGPSASITTSRAAWRSGSLAAPARARSGRSRARR